MDAKRARIFTGSAFAVGLLVSSWVAPAAAADCSLTAPATVKVGAQLTIDGAGFPANSSVDIKFTIEGDTPDEFAVQSNASGGFQINLTPEQADAGKTSVIATAGSACSAQVIFAVLGANQTAPPTTDPSDAAAASPEPISPRTDAESGVEARIAGATRNGWLLAILAVAIGVGGLFATTMTRSR